MTVNAKVIQGAAQIIPDSSGQAYRSPAEKTKDNAVSFADMMKSTMSTRQGMVQSANTTSDKGDMQLNAFNAQPQISGNNGSDAGTGQNASMQSKNSDGNKSTEPLPQDKIEAASEAVSEIADGVTENVTEELEITEEDLDEVMETMELAYLDLLNPQALTQVVEEATAVEPEAEPRIDVSEIVAELVPANEEVIATALEDNGISLEEFSQFFDQVNSGDIEIPEEIAELMPTTVPEDIEGTGELAAAILEPVAEEPVTEAAVPVEEPVTESTSVTVTVIRIEDSDFDNNVIPQNIVPKDETFDGARPLGDQTANVDPKMSEELSEAIPGETVVAMTEDILDDAASVITSETLENADTTEAPEVGTENENSIFDNLTAAIANDITEEAQTGEFGSSGNRQGSNLGAGQDASNLAMNVRNDLMADAAAINQQPADFAQTLTETAAQTPVTPYTSAQTADIMNQIVTQASVTINETVSRMEMELNPQNLGRMIMQVQQQEGMVTAKLIAQNENVRNAIETQLMQLRENLEQKGIKVDAVEVTVGTHEFERNLEEGMADQAFTEQQQEASEGRNGSRGNRNLNRSELDSLEGELSEEEALAAAIMRDNGGTVDYTA